MKGGIRTLFVLSKESGSIVWRETTTSGDEGGTKRISNSSLVTSGKGKGGGHPNTKVI